MVLSDLEVERAAVGEGDIGAENVGAALLAVIRRALARHVPADHVARFVHAAVRQVRHVHEGAAAAKRSGHGRAPQDDSSLSELVPLGDVVAGGGREGVGDYAEGRHLRDKG